MSGTRKSASRGARSGRAKRGAVATRTKRAPAVSRKRGAAATGNGAPAASRKRRSPAGGERAPAARTTRGRLDSPGVGARLRGVPEPGRAPRRPAPLRAKSAAKSPRLAVVPKPPARPAKPAPPPAFPQVAGASSKQLTLFQLVKARTQFLGAIQGLTAGAAEQPLAPGKWNTRQIVLHLCCRDRARLREFEAALRGVQVSWRDFDDEEMARANAQDLAGLSHLAWDEAVRLLHATRESLLEAVEGVPEEPAEVWDAEHAFGWMLQRLPIHDRHHAETIKQWRVEAGA